MNRDDIISWLERWSLLQAESAGLSWGADGKRIQAIAVEQDAVTKLMPHPPFDRMNGPVVHPYYWSIDDGELVGGYVRDTADGLGVACGILDLIASRMCEECAVSVGHAGHINWHVLLHTFGSAVVEPSMTALRGALASLRHEHVRYEVRQWPTDEAGEPIEGDGEPPLVIASIDSGDSRFDEEGFTPCPADAAHAVEIVRFDLDEDLFAPARELVEARGAAAKRVLRGNIDEVTG